MDKVIEVNSGLPCILLLDRITAISPAGIRGTCTFAGKMAFTMIEALAQLGAFHVRWSDGFVRQAFLMKIGGCALPDPLPASGPLALQGELTGQSERSFSYRMKAERRNGRVMEGDFWFSTVNYDERFDSKKLKDHYEKVFACLTSVSGTD
jgi:hypothetical protein